jgi:hypothetical protein
VTPTTDSSATGREFYNGHTFEVEELGAPTMVLDGITCVPALLSCCVTLGWWCRAEGVDGLQAGCLLAAKLDAFDSVAAPALVCRSSFVWDSGRATARGWLWGLASDD